MTLMVKPKYFQPNTMVRLLYERVPHHYKPNMAVLDDPVIDYMPLIRSVQSYYLTELPKGKYIVCGEAMLHGKVYQSSCCENKIERMHTRSERALLNQNNINLSFFSIATGSQNTHFYCNFASSPCDYLRYCLPNM